MTTDLRAALEDIATPKSFSFKLSKANTINSLSKLLADARETARAALASDAQAGGEIAADLLERLDREATGKGVLDGDGTDEIIAEAAAAIRLLLASPNSVPPAALR